MASKSEIEAKSVEAAAGSVALGAIVGMGSVGGSTDGKPSGFF